MTTHSNDPGVLSLSLIVPIFGLDQLYRSASHSQQFEIRYLTASPGELQNFGKRFLSQYQFPDADLFWGRPDLEISAFDFKYAELKRWIIECPDCELVWIGDNTEDDANVFVKLAKNYPDRPLRGFIHFVLKSLKGQSSRGLKFWLTPIDLAFHLATAKVVDPLHALEIAEKGIKNWHSSRRQDRDAILPSYIRCDLFWQNIWQSEGLPLVADFIELFATNSILYQRAQSVTDRFQHAMLNQCQSR